MCKIYTKIDSWFQKSHEEFGQLQTSTGKSKKLKFDGLLLSKNKFVQKIHSFSWNIIYRVFNFQLLVWKFTKLLMSLYHFLQHNSSVFFLAQTLHNFYKSSPSKCKFLDFLLLGLKFTKFLMSFFKQKVSFSSKFGSFFSVMRDNSSVLFSWNFICYWQNWYMKVQMFRLATARIKIHQILHVFFETKSQLFFKLCITI